MHSGAWTTEIFLPARYKSIISKYLPQEKDRLIQDYGHWKRSSDYKLYWLEKSRTSVQLDTRVECSSFAGDVLRQETAAITTSINDDYANIDSNNNMGMAASSSFSSSTAIQDSESIPSSSIPTTSSATTPLDTIATITTEGPPCFPWLIGDFDVADAFYRYRCHVIQQANDRLLQIEKSVHELLSLSHILLLCPNQHSDTMLHFFDLAQLQKLHYSLLTESLNDSITLPDDIYLKLVYAVTDVDAKVKTRGQVELLLLTMAQDLDIRQQSVVWGGLQLRKLCD
ncbi:uncharacterized protein ATC70_002076 [Mucor velutinosus]|uniref:Uncharacterized protein n=1 Tax=Mucor velutinosus TaxID=708070 RepID=A0AAN7DCQ3_9FUNG|nr:hypothetical protein ATC70_002076 [Mucor velutinosus]